MWQRAITGGGGGVTFTQKVTSTTSWSAGFISFDVNSGEKVVSATVRYVANSVATVIVTDESNWAYSDSNSADFIQADITLPQYANLPLKQTGTTVRIGLTTTSSSVGYFKVVYYVES